MVSSLPALPRGWPGAVIIPARDEEGTVGEVVRGVTRNAGAFALVIDDASSDDTASEARASGAEVVTLPFSLGAWGATQTGLRLVMEIGYPFAMTMDADGQHLAEFLGPVSEPVRQGLCDVAIGVCPERASAARRVAWVLLRTITGLRLQDITSGLRAYNRRAMRLLTSESATALSYQDIGLLLLLREAGLAVGEVKVDMHRRRSGCSRVYDSWGTVAAYLMETLILSAAKWSPAWHIDRTIVMSHGDADSA